MAILEQLQDLYGWIALDVREPKQILVLAPSQGGEEHHVSITEMSEYHVVCYNDFF